MAASKVKVRDIKEGDRFTHVNGRSVTVKKVSNVGSDLVRLDCEYEDSDDLLIHTAHSNDMLDAAPEEVPHKNKKKRAAH